NGDGSQLMFDNNDHDLTFDALMTSPDTIYVLTFAVLATEHDLYRQIVTEEQREEVEAYILAASMKSDLDRTDLAKEKTGVFTGAYGIHPLTGEPFEIWVADYVLASYGTGAVMAVPAHDSRG